MYIPKRYGEARIDRCPFCQQQATVENGQGVPVCRDHRHAELGDMRCLCGASMELKKGKFGVFFNCITCGNMNLRKALEINEVKAKPQPAREEEIPEKKERPPKRERTEIVFRSDEPWLFE
ncbi:MAG: hypothetical protein V1735_02145 [Nanoarchaeota archaeon]